MRDHPLTGSGKCHDQVRQSTGKCFSHGFQVGKKNGNDLCMYMTFAMGLYCILLYHYVLYDTCTVGKIWKHEKLKSILMFIY
jgi:uncharacterized protein (DUF983 family)